MSLKFGTDGVRGHADELDDAFVAALAQAAARVLGNEHGRFVVGMDTRESGPRLERALRVGLEVEGYKVEVLGVVPTPAVACLSATEDVPGAMISASHNAYTDNGIKFFAAGGLKLTDAVEEELEAELEKIRATGSELAVPEGVDEPDAGRIVLYEDTIIESLEGRRLDGLKVVVDCANGAASHVAPEVLGRLGADVIVLHAEPDGRNINEQCGSTHPEDLQRAVVRHQADAGLAFDGDADRVLAADESGQLVDGDQIIAMCAIDRRDRGTLAGDTVAVTVMSNLGFRLGMRAHAIEVVETQVGDRYVLEALESGGFNLGGEQSGHVIFRDLATTGDGLLTGVQLLDLMGRSGRYLSDLASSAMQRLPQVLKSVWVREQQRDIATLIEGDIAAIEGELGERGRVLVRASGTEPLVRVMVEAEHETVADRAADRLVAAVERVAN
ncbi:MAG: phosphoglucosamine mutase [Actinobacteria bacterium]|nr:phosphoglucosamine mutase [Actinomycetota bacterium]